MTLETIRVRKPIGRGFIHCKAIKLYPSCIDAIVYSSIEKNEEPNLLVKCVWNERLNVFEIEVVCLGNYHAEKPSYYNKPRANWISFAEFILAPEEALKLGTLLTNLTNINSQGVEGNEL